MHKHRTRFRAIIAGLGSLSALASFAPDVEACTPAPNGWTTQLENDELPTNGYLVMSQHCWMNCGSGPEEPAITVRDTTTGADVPGTVAPLPDVDESLHVYGWRATSPLVAGGNYQVMIASYFNSNPQPIQVVEPGDPDPTTMDLTPEIGPLEVEAGERTCCPSGPIDTCGGKRCYYDELERSVWIMLDWSLTPDAAHFSQYLRRVTWEGRAEPDPWNIGLSAGTNYETAQSEYCYTLELKSLIDGSIQRFDRACVAHPAGLELGVFAVDPTVLKSQLGVCDEPPAGLEESWCEARAEQCAEYPFPECSNLRELCPEDPPGTGGSGAESTETTEGAGCSIAAAGSGRQLGFAWAMAALAVGLVFRRVRNTV